MDQRAKWVRFQMTCPEGLGESELLLEWRSQAEGEVLNSVSCKNPQLKDLSGSACQWSCWEKIVEETSRMGAQRL